jgi:5'-methylthioadenosine phosphorylase
MRANHASVPPMLGIIGGSGIYDVEGLSDVRWEAVDTPYGSSSDELMFGTLDGFPIVFLPRHGRGHRVPPSELNFRANIHALKRVGV